MDEGLRPYTRVMESSAGARTLADFAVGQSFEAGPVLLTEAETLDFARRYDPQPAYLDPVVAEKSDFGGLVASGWLVAALTMRLLLESGACNGLVGRELESLEWPTPVRPGDSLRIRSEIIEVIPTPSGKGDVRFRTVTFNQRGETVQILRSCGAISRRMKDGRRG